MRRIEISQECHFLYGTTEDWKMYAYGENFDDSFVINANGDFNEIESADWYQKAKDILTDIDCYYDEISFRDEYKSELSMETINAIIDLYNNCRCTEDIICDVLNLLYPEAKYVTRTIRGYVQRDWNEVIYDSNKISDEVIKTIESFYFGMVSEIFDTTESVCDVITDDELWKLQREGKLESEIRERLDIPDNEEIEIYEQDGYVQLPKWKKVV